LQRRVLQLGAVELVELEEVGDVERAVDAVDVRVR
jgi:hypothetical protein